MIAVQPVNYILPAGVVAAHFKKSEGVSNEILQQAEKALLDLDTFNIKSSFLAGPVEYNTSNNRKNACGTLVLVSCMYDDELKEKTPIKTLIDIHKLRIVIMGPNNTVKVYPFNTDTKKPNPANYGGIISASKTFITNKTLATPVAKVLNVCI